MEVMIFAGILSAIVLVIILAYLASREQMARTWMPDEQDADIEHSPNNNQPRSPVERDRHERDKGIPHG